MLHKSYLSANVKEGKTTCSEPIRWKTIYAFCSGVQLKCAVQDSPWQHLQLISGRERCEPCSSCWNILITVSCSWLQALGLSPNLIISKVWISIFSQSEKHFSSRLLPSNSDLSSSYHTNLGLKTGQWIGPAAFNYLLISSELLFFKLLVQLLNFPPQHYHLLVVLLLLLLMSLLLLFNCFFLLEDNSHPSHLKIIDSWKAFPKMHQITASEQVS